MLKMQQDSTVHALLVCELEGRRGDGERRGGGDPPQFLHVQIASGPSTGEKLQFCVSLFNTTVGGLAHSVKQKMQKMQPSRETTVKRFVFQGRSFFPGSHQGPITLSDSGYWHTGGEMIAFLYDWSVGSSDSPLSVHL